MRIAANPVERIGIQLNDTVFVCVVNDDAKNLSS